MIDEYYEDDYNDYDDYDDEYCAPPPPPKPKPKATKPAKKTITPKAKVDSPKTTPKLDQLAKKVAKINLVAELEKRSKEKVFEKIKFSNKLFEQANRISGRRRPHRRRQIDPSRPVEPRSR